MTQRSVDRTTLLELIVQFFKLPTGTCCSNEYHGLPSAHQTQWEYALHAPYAYGAWLKASKVARLISATWHKVPTGTPLRATYLSSYTYNDLGYASCMFPLCSQLGCCLQHRLTTSRHLHVRGKECITICTCSAGS